MQLLARVKRLTLCDSRIRSYQKPIVPVCCTHAVCMMSFGQQTRHPKLSNQLTRNHINVLYRYIVHLACPEMSPKPTGITYIPPSPDVVWLDYIMANVHMPTCCC